MSATSQRIIDRLRVWRSPSRRSSSEKAVALARVVTRRARFDPLPQLPCPKQMAIEGVSSIRQSDRPPHFLNGDINSSAQRMPISRT